MNTATRLLFLAIALFGAITPLHAAPKERLVLMSLRLAEDDRALQGVMEAALVEGLQQKYKVYSGEEVAQKAKAIFDKESKTTKKDCDETRCMQDIALAFNAELIATATVQKQNDGYFLALKIQDIMDNTVVYSKSMPCEGCNRYAVVDKLKELVGTAPSAQAASTEVKPVQAASGNDAESEIWKTLEASGSVEDYQAYVDEYPKGKYAFLAKARIKKLQQEGETLSANEKVQAQKAEQQQQMVKAADDKIASAYGLVSIPGKPWKMMKYEVTFDQWDACLAGGGCDGIQLDDEKWGRGSRPVLNVSWNEVQSYISWINTKTGKKFRLPSEEEWEYAARAGTSTDFWWGNDVGDNNANCDGCGGQWENDSTAPVGSFKPNAYGLYDTVGNVSEWTQSCWQGNCGQHVVRGGSWYSRVRGVNVSYRGWLSSSDRVYQGGRSRGNLGFRLLLDP